MSEEVTEENVGGTEEEIPEEEPVLVAPVERKAATGAYKKVELKVETVKKEVPDIPHVEQDEGKNQAPAATFTKEDSHFFAQTIWTIPQMVFGDYMEVNEKLVNAWGDQLFSYCEKKGFSPLEYFFDELPLLIATGSIVGSLAVKQREHKKKLKDDKEKEDEEES